MITREAYLSPDEVAALRQAAKPFPRMLLLVEAALQTGLRVGELARLRLGHIDFPRRIVHVGRQKKRGGLSPDTIPLPVGLAGLIRKVVCSKVDRRQSDLTISPDTPLFVGQRGPMGKQGLQKLWKKACRLAGLSPDTHIHQARHTLAVQLLKNAPNPSQAMRLVQKQLGHSSIDTTANMYADVPWDDRAEALERAWGG